MSATQPATAVVLARGICRALEQLGYASLLEFPLANRRRADILALGKTGDLMIIEIKSSVADFRADRKWAFYREFADRLYFAVPNEFPVLLIPEECGLIVADGVWRGGAAPRRPDPARPGAAPRPDPALRARRGEPAAPPARSGGGAARWRPVTHVDRA